MKLRLAVSAALFAMALATPALSADLKYKPGEGPFNWQNFEDLKKNDLKGETLTIFGPWRGDDEAHVVDEEDADVALREAVHAGDEPRAGQEGPEDGQEEGQADQEHVPDLQHVPALLDHGRVHVGTGREPWEKRCVFDGIPSPVATPPKLFVGPEHAKRVADRQEQPRKEHPLARRHDPLVVEPSRDQRGDGKRKGYRRAGKPDVQARRVYDHVEVAELVVEPAALDRSA